MSEPLHRTLSFSLTEAGADLARRLPYEHHPGPVVAAIRSEWDRADRLVVIGSTAIAVRAVAPLLSDKSSEPAVVCVDEAGRYAVALLGGHRGGNDLAREVAALIGAEAVVSTGTEVAGIPALDALPHYRAEGDISGATRRWLDGNPPFVDVDRPLEGWPLPAALARPGNPDGPDGPGGRGGRVTVTDSDRRPDPGEVLLRPGSLVVGIGASRGADAAALEELLTSSLASAACHRAAVAAIATVDLKADEPALLALAERMAVPLLTFSAEGLAGQAVPNPSDVVDGFVGTPSVAEAAALLGAGPGSHLVATKQVSATRDSTVAVARKAKPAGHLYVVGVGPGDPNRRTPEAATAIRHADAVIGYGPYVDLAADLLSARQEVLRSPIGAERQRAADALARAAAGQTVALVCSGDPGVYAMASLVCELAPAAGDPPMTVVPGVTAALAGAAVLGAPLGHDHASVSLSDLLTPWAVIVARLEAVAAGDFVVSLYNPRSQRRSAQLDQALAILAEHRPGSTPAAVLTDVGRPGQTVTRTTLAQLDSSTVGMLSLVVVGSSQTRWIGQRMVTPRGYLS